MTDSRLVRPSWRGRTNVDALTISAIERAEQRPGGHEFVVTQGSYQNGQGEVLSAGTHDGGGAVDLVWCGHVACLLALRKAGLWAWHRTPAQGPWKDHIHAIVVDHPALSAGAAAQIASARRGRNGLKGDGPDDGPATPVVAPVWPVKPPKPAKNLVQKARGQINAALKDLSLVPADRTAVRTLRREVRAALRKAPKA